MNMTGRSSTRIRLANHNVHYTQQDADADNTGGKLASSASIMSATAATQNIENTDNDKARKHDVDDESDTLGGC
jgi:hypothetical protein